MAALRASSASRALRWRTAAVADCRRVRVEDLRSGETAIAKYDSEGELLAVYDPDTLTLLWHSRRQWRRVSAPRGNFWAALEELHQRSFGRSPASAALS